MIGLYFRWLEEGELLGQGFFKGGVFLVVEFLQGLDQFLGLEVFNNLEN